MGFCIYICIILYKYFILVTVFFLLIEFGHFNFFFTHNFVTRLEDFHLPQYCLRCCVFLTTNGTSAFPHHCLILLKLIGHCIYQTFYMFTWLSESETFPTFAPFWQKPVRRCSQSYLWQYDALQDIGVLGRILGVKYLQYVLNVTWKPFKHISFWVVVSSQGSLGLLF